MAASLFSQRILDQATAQARPTIDAREDAMHRNAGQTSPIFIDSKLPHDLSDHSSEVQAPRQLFSLSIFR